MDFESQLPHKIVNLRFYLVIVKQEIDDFVGELTVESHVTDAFCEIRFAKRFPEMPEPRVFEGRRGAV